MFKPILFIMDKRFFRKIDKNLKTYYNKNSDNEFDIEEPF